MGYGRGERGTDAVGVEVWCPWDCDVGEEVRVSLCRHGCIEPYLPPANGGLGVWRDRRDTEEEGSVGRFDRIIQEADSSGRDEVGGVLARVVFGRVVVPGHGCIVEDVCSGIDEDWGVVSGWSLEDFDSLESLESLESLCRRFSRLFVDS